MSQVFARECSYSDSGSSSHSRISYGKHDKVDMRSQEGVCTGSVSNLAHEIPFDLLTVEILPRLPPKSLKRFQCVSKEWLSTIRDQRFIKSFSTMSHTRPRFLVAVRTAENHVFLLSSSLNETERSATLATNLEMRALHGCYVDHVYSSSLHANLEMTVSGLFVDLVHCNSVHGFIGLSHPSDPGRFTVCNPSTRQVITLPDIKASRGGRDDGVYMYLGYDPVGNEYKALCSSVMCGERRLQEHKVLTLSGGGKLSWRDIKGGRTLRYKVVTNGICTNGWIYYVGTLLSQDKRPVVFCFDVRGERMRYTKPLFSAITRATLINYNGKLGAAYIPPDLKHPGLTYVILVLEDVDRGMWSRKIFFFNPVLLELSGKTQLKILGRNKTNDIILGPQKLPPKDVPVYIFYINIDYKKRELMKRVKLEGLEEFGCNHTDDDEQCVCQLLFSPDHFESLFLSL